MELEQEFARRDKFLSRCQDLDAGRQSRWKGRSTSLPGRKMKSNGKQPKKHAKSIFPPFWWTITLENKKANAVHEIVQWQIIDLKQSKKGMLGILLACMTMGRKENANVPQRILILDSNQADNVISPELDSSIQPFHFLHFFYAVTY